MKLLIDNALSPLVAERLRATGQDVVHVREVGLRPPRRRHLRVRPQRGAHPRLRGHGLRTTLFRLRARHPSVILFRHDAERDPDQQAKLLELHLPSLAGALAEGSLVVFEPARIRIRSLPILEM